MSASTVNISFSKDLLLQIDKIAKEEMRSRSELAREVFRMYIELKKRRQNLFTYGQNITFENGILQEDILNEIEAHRKRK